MTRRLRKPQHLQPADAEVAVDVEAAAGLSPPPLQPLEPLAKRKRKLKEKAEAVAAEPASIAEPWWNRAIM